MKKKYYQNTWLPLDEFSIEEMDLHKEWLSKALILERKILNKTATKKEQIDYCTYQLRSSKDKLDIIKTRQGLLN